MRLLTQDELIKILPINKTAIDRLVSLGKIPYKSINTENGNIIRFNPEIISSWIKNGINLMDDKKYLERLKNRLQSINPESIEELKKFSAKFVDPVIPKRYYLEPVKNKKLGFVFYVKYLHNGVLVRTKWSTGTNDKELAIRFAIENRERLLKEYLEGKEKPSIDIYSILKTYYAKDSQYLNIDIKRGRSIKEKHRVFCYNFINRSFIPYLKKCGVKSVEEITTPFLSKFQNYLLTKNKKGVKPQTVNVRISHISMIFNRLLLDGLISVNPCKSLVSIKSKQGDKKITGCYDIEILKGVFNKRWDNEFYCILNLLIYTTNLRNCEIENIRLSDFTIIDNFHFLNVPDSKTPNGIRTVPIHNFVYKKLMGYAKKNNKTDYILKPKAKLIQSTEYKKAAIELAKHLGYTEEYMEKENITFYSGRHFWKTLTDAEGLGDIGEIFMGHRVSADVSKIYNHKDKIGKTKKLEKVKHLLKILDKYIFEEYQK
jgi:integrase